MLSLEKMNNASEKRSRKQQEYLKKNTEQKDK